MATGKAKTSASTLPTRARTNTVPKNKPDGKRRQIDNTAPVEVVEQTDVEEDDPPVIEDEGDEGGGDEADEGVSTEIDETADEEPLAASDAEEPPPEPEAPARRGRPKGPRAPKSPATARVGGDIYTTLCEAGLTIKRIAEEHKKSPAEILTAIGKMIDATSVFDNV